MALEELAARWRLRLERGPGPWREAAGPVAGAPVILAEPLTYMNRSGEAAAALLVEHRLGPDSLIAIYDDLDIPFGTLRLRPQGGAAGHRGVLSLIEALGTERFPRLRLGLGGIPMAVEPAEFVLEEFTQEEWPTARSVAGRAADALEVAAGRGFEAAMNQFNAAPAADGG